MYQLDWVSQLRSGKAFARSPSPILSVSSVVWRLGYTSFFTDVSSEMVSSILPVYFVLHLHFSPLQFGVLDGIYQGAAVALLSIASGVYADRRRRHKEVATAGYALSALSKAALLAAGNVWAIVACVLAIDRVGKGIRTAPRDAMISFCSRRGSLATAFSVHRGLDAGGAVVGPLLSWLLLRLLPGTFDLVLITSACIALVGLGVIVLLVEPQGIPMREAAASPFRLPNGVWRHPGFLPVLVAGGALGAATVSDGFIYLLIQRNTKSSVSAIPLMAFLTALCYLLLSVPAGRLADRLGREKIFLAGYAMMFLIYGILLSPALGSTAQFAIIGLFGMYYAATDGVLAAMASTALSPELRSSGLALLNTVTGLSRLVSSVLFGWLWVAGTTKTPLWVFLVGLLSTMLISVLILANRRHE